MKKERRNAVQLNVPALNTSRGRDSESFSDLPLTEVLTQVHLTHDKSTGPRMSSCDFSSIENSTFSTDHDHSDYSTDRLSFSRSRRATAFSSCDSRGHKPKPRLVRTKSGNNAVFIMSAEDAHESVAVLEYADGKRVIRNDDSYFIRSRKRPGERTLSFKAPIIKRHKDLDQFLSDMDVKSSHTPESSHKTADFCMSENAGDTDLPDNLDESDSDSSEIFVKRTTVSSCHTPETQHSSATTSVELGEDHGYSEKLVKSDNDDVFASDLENIFEDNEQDQQREESESRMGWIGEEECRELFNMTMSDIKSYTPEWWKQHSQSVQKQQLQADYPGYAMPS